MALTLDEYQRMTRSFALYPEADSGCVNYPILGLCGEAGEVAEKLKKIIRDKNGVIEEDDRQAFKKELGDVLWYIAATAAELKFSLSDVALANITKLSSRQKQNKIHGSGDNREEENGN